jgi:L-lactate dehydrogenase complex protein LldG
MNRAIDDSVIDRVRRALGRTASLAAAPTPPVIDEPTARLVHSDIGLPELFQTRAAGMKMLVELVRVDDLLERLVAFLREQNCKSAMLSDTPLLRKLNVLAFLQQNGIAAKSWADMPTADEAYEFDAGVTEADYAVAETGTLVIRHRPEHGRLLSLVPFVHVAIIEPKILVPDLIDLFDRLDSEGTGSGVTMISGPSKTADIEMNTVTGVHGPNVVKTYVLS